MGMNQIARMLKKCKKNVTNYYFLANTWFLTLHHWGRVEEKSANMQSRNEFIKVTFHRYMCQRPGFLVNMHWETRENHLDMVKIHDNFQQVDLFNPCFANSNLSETSRNPSQAHI